MSESMILTRKESGAFIITLNRPEKRNAMPIEMMWEIGAALEEAAADRSSRAVIIHGEGKCFSAGIDVNSLAGIGQLVDAQPQFRSLLSRMQGVFNSMEAIEKPVIAAIHSLCIGMGLELALAADFRIATEGTKFAIPEAEFGLIPDVGGTSRLTRLVGSSYAKELIMMCRRIDERKALRIGLINEIVPPDKLMETAMQWVADLQTTAPLAVGMAKKIINRGAQLDPLTFQELEAYAQSTLLKTDDVREGLMSKLQKRKPEFKGK